MDREEIRRIIGQEFLYAAERGWLSPRGRTRQAKRRNTAAYKEFFAAAALEGDMTTYQLVRYISDMHAPDVVAW